MSLLESGVRSKVSRWKGEGYEEHFAKYEEVINFYKDELDVIKKRR